MERERDNAMCPELDYWHKRVHKMLSKNVVLIGTFLLKASKGELWYNNRKNPCWDCTL